MLRVILPPDHKGFSVTVPPPEKRAPRSNQCESVGKWKHGAMNPRLMGEHDRCLRTTLNITHLAAQVSSFECWLR